MHLFISIILHLMCLKGVEFRPLRLDDFVVNDGVEDEISIPGLSDRTRIDIGEDEPDCD